MQSTRHTATAKTWFNVLFKWLTLTTLASSRLTATSVQMMNWHANQKTQGVLPWRNLILTDEFKSAFGRKFIRCGKPEKSYNWSPHCPALLFFYLFVFEVLHLPATLRNTHAQLHNQLRRMGIKDWLKRPTHLPFVLAHFVESFFFFTFNSWLGAAL